MKRKFKSILAGILCLACLPVMPLSASAKVDIVEYDYEKEYKGPSGHSIDYIETRHRIELHSDAFSYSLDRVYREDGSFWRSAGFLETDVVEAGFIVTGVYYNEGESEPCWYTLNEIDSGIRTADGLDVQCKAETIAPYLEGDTPKVGDLLYIENWARNAIYPPLMYFFEDSIYAPVVKNLGSGIDIFGEDFKKVLYYELYEEPVVGYPYCESPASQSGYRYEIYDKGNLNNDDSINLVDVVTLNKHLMTGYPIGYYAQGCADVDNNGVVNATDTLNILKYSIGLIESFEEIQE